MKKGSRDLITDVPGLRVGHATVDGKDVHTGVTVILPHGGNLFREKLPAACHVMNGFGKSAGTVQVNELGTIEAPIALTNTFSVGTCVNALVRFSLSRNREIGDTTGTVNTTVFECNDGYLSDIRAMAVREEDVFSALGSASSDFAEGDVGAGRGMVCYGLKGGIGSASRRVEIGGRAYTVGTLLLTNFGAREDLVISGDPVGRKLGGKGQEDKGSVITVIATDVPLSHRQLLRCTHRVQNGIARTGSYMGSGSGEIALAFSVAARIPHASPSDPVLLLPMIHEDAINLVFQAVVECVEESVVSSLVHAHTLRGRAGHTVLSLSDALRTAGL